MNVKSIEIHSNSHNLVANWIDPIPQEEIDWIADKYSSLLIQVLKSEFPDATIKVVTHDAYGMERDPIIDFTDDTSGYVMDQIEDLINSICNESYSKVLDAHVEAFPPKTEVVKEAP